MVKAFSLRSVGCWVGCLTSLSIVLLALPLGAAAPDVFIILASTTSTDNSGLLDEILPKFTASSGVDVRVVAVGTGQAIRLARNGDADVLMVHDRVSEERFVSDGFGVERHPLMHNDYVLVGPRVDPAQIRGMTDVGAALARIADGAQPFASRGDDSGTHKAEMRIWKAADRDPTLASGMWYRETGSGMGATLNTAAAMGAYAFVDRGTWLAFKNRVDLELLVTGDPRLRNPYSVILVSSAKHRHVKAEAGQAFIDWLLSPSGQKAIGDFRVNGEVLFIPARS